MLLDMYNITVGAKVLCIDGYDTRQGEIKKHPISENELSYPITGRTYTVREVVEYSRGKGLLFLEVQNPAVIYPKYGLCEPAWDPFRFKLLEQSI